jgi:hypothetical protein
MDAVVNYINGTLQNNLNYIFDTLDDLQTQITNNNNSINARLTSVHITLNNQINSAVGILNASLSSIQNSLQSKITSNTNSINSNLAGILSITGTLSSEVARIDALHLLNVNRIDNSIGEIQTIFYKIGDGLGVDELSEIGNAIGGIKADILKTLRDERESLGGNLLTMLHDKLHPVTDYMNLFSKGLFNVPVLNNWFSIHTLNGLKHSMTPVTNRLTFVTPRRRADSQSVINLANFIKAILGK